MSDYQHILLLADIHANEMALQAVIKDVSRRYHRKLPIWFVGDLFGRGPDPVNIWYSFQEHKPEAVVVGNHDWAITGRNTNIIIDGKWDGSYNPADWQVLMSHRKELNNSFLLDTNETGQSIGGDIHNALGNWPIVCEPRPGIYMIHGGQEFAFMPDKTADLLPSLVWGYVKEAHHARYTTDMTLWLYQNQGISPEIVSYNTHLQRPHLIILGHWHYRRLYFSKGDRWVSPIQLDRAYDLTGHTESPIIVSPGSVGFPAEINDRDASYAVLCLKNDVPYSIVFHTVAYKRELVRKKMKQRGYPEETVRRLRLVGENDE